MTAPAIKVECLWKEYVIGSQAKNQTFREMLVDSVSSPFKRLVQGQVKAPPEEQFWALRDISFEIQPGEVVGIIGRNGAGKSTLLKILSRITEPTRGGVEIRGRVSSLLEVGTGFHPELTGRENIFLNGAILGMSHREIQSKFDEIVAFAEIEKFLDTPVKHYSSGMYVRLAFAVAANLEPDILVVDEVLAVGDVQFQKKCLGKMEQVSRGGRTILLVSHNLLAIQSLCSRTLHLEQGQIVAFGPTKAVVGRYLSEQGVMNRSREWSVHQAPSGGGVRLMAARISAAAEGQFTTANGLTLELLYQVEKEGLSLNISIAVQTESGACAFASASLGDGFAGHPFAVDTYRSLCSIPPHLLNDSVYYVDVFFVRDFTTVVLRVEKVLSFEIVDDGQGRSGWFGDWPGVVRPRLEWRSSKCSA